MTGSGRSSFAPGTALERLPLPSDALFICIGGTPLADGAAGIGLVTNSAGYLVTGSDAASDPGGNWPLGREPLPLETNRPGVFAAGDVRCGSVKALRGGHRRGINGRGAGPPAAGGGGR